MTSRGVLLLLQFLTFFRLARGDFVCMTPQAFEASNQPGKDRDFEVFRSRNPSSFYHDYLFSLAPKLLKDLEDERGIVMDAKPEATVKQILLVSETKSRETQREIKMTRELCGVEAIEVSNHYICQHSFITKYYGCVADGKAVYIYREKIMYTLHSPDYSFVYREWSSYFKVETMLDIIDQFIEFHKLGMVHSDIRPENVMTKSLKNLDFKISGFKYANPQGAEFLGGTPGYLAPERVYQTSQKFGLTYTEDVFSLAMTLVKMEGYYVHSDFFHKEGSSMNLAKLAEEGCFNPEKSPTDCEQKIIDRLGATFDSKKGYDFGFLIPIFTTALSFDPKKRYPTMKKFSLAIIKEFKSLNKAEEFIKMRVENRKLEDPDNKIKSFWRDYTSCLTYEIHKKLSFVSDVLNFFSSDECNIDDLPAVYQIKKIEQGLKAQEKKLTLVKKSDNPSGMFI